MQEKDYLMRLIKQIVDGLIKAKRRSEEKETCESQAEGGDDVDLDSVFEDTIGLSRAFLPPSMVGMIPKMLAVNPDSARSILAARLLLGRAEIVDDGKPYRDAARALLDESSSLPMEIELAAIRSEALTLLQQ